MYDDGDMYYRPYGGAKTFAEARKFQDLQEKIHEDNEAVWMLQDIMRNINSDPKMSIEEKSAAIKKVADEFGSEVAKTATKKAEKGGIFGRIKSAFSESMSEAIELTPGAGFRIKETDAGMRWFGVYSNNTQDREKEIITKAAHQEFADYCEKSGEYPELWLWHTKGTRIGVADWIDEHEGFALASGLIDVDVPPAVIDNLRNYPVPLGMSHGFGFKDADLVDGVYHRYRSVELSVLPIDSAANELTSFGTEVPVTMSDNRKAFLGEVVGVDNAEGFYNGVSSLAEFAKKNNVTVKSLLTAIAEGVDGAPGSTDGAPAAPKADTPTPAAPAADGAPLAPGGDPVLAAVTKALDAFAEKVDARFKALESDTDSQITKALTDVFVRSTKDQARNSAVFGGGAPGEIVGSDDRDVQAATKSNGEQMLNLPPSSALNGLFGEKGHLHGMLKV